MSQGVKADAANLFENVGVNATMPLMTNRTGHAKKAGGLSPAREFLLFLSIPITVIVVVAAIVQGPSLFARPSYDFIYSVCDDYDCTGNYTISTNDRVAFTPDDNEDGATSKPTLYYYSETSQVSRQITMKQASDYRLDTSNVSPDGYILWQDSGSDSGLLSTGGDGSWYLKHGAKRKQLKLNTDNVYDNNVQLIGWTR